MNRAMTIRLALAALLFAGCDNGNANCGNGAIEIPEVCDDTNGADGDGCASNCVIEEGWTCAGVPSTCRRTGPGECGNGVLEAGEECDDGGESGACDIDCTFGRCGDGYINDFRGEQCDDGNGADGDGCSSFCTFEGISCGDGECDDLETCTGCPMDCMAEFRCRECFDMDGDGFTDSACGGPDCNDFDNTIHPDATEIPCNRVDEDCDPSTVDALDEDGDLSSCNFDCDDSDPLRSPLFLERCANGIDDDCNPETPDDVDLDGDGWSCSVDCDDFRAESCPDCPELCNNGIDDDCDPSTTDVDADLDGECHLDCDDSDPNRAARFTEICGNGIDDDCDAATLDDVVDSDGDSFTCEVDCDDMDIATFPDAMGFCGPMFTYFEDFEGGDGGWTSRGTLSSWAHGTPNDTFIDGAASGDNAWVTGLSSNYVNNELSYLESPPLDFSATLTDPVLVFSLIYETESCCDEGWVEVSTNGGGSWNKLGSQGDGPTWYNSPSHYWNGTSGPSGQWQTAQHVLTRTAGFSDVRIRFVLSADGFGTREGFGIDDVLVTNQYLDAEVRSIGVGSETCANATHPISVRIRNNGATPVSDLTVSYTIDGGAPVVETAAGVLNGGASRLHVFATPADLSTLGAHTIVATVALPSDTLASNDSRTRVVDVQDAPFVVLGAGYSEGFEADDGGFTVGGMDPSWAHGTPAGAFIPAAASGTRAWVTNLTGNYNTNEDSYVVSGCFDFSAAATDPTLSFAHIFEFEDGWDDGWVEVYTATSDGWVTLGERGTGTNWYNDAFDVWTGTSGGSGVWRTASHVMTGTAGEPVVRFRFAIDSDPSTNEEGMGIDDVTITP